MLISNLQHKLHLTIGFKNMLQLSPGLVNFSLLGDVERFHDADVPPFVLAVAAGEAARDFFLLEPVAVPSYYMLKYLHECQWSAISNAGVLVDAACKDEAGFICALDLDLQGDNALPIRRWGLEDLERKVLGRLVVRILLVLEVVLLKLLIHLNSYGSQS